MKEGLVRLPRDIAILQTIPQKGPSLLVELPLKVIPDDQAKFIRKAIKCIQTDKRKSDDPNKARVYLNQYDIAAGEVRYRVVLKKSFGATHVCLMMG